MRSISLNKMILFFVSLVQVLLCFILPNEKLKEIVHLLFFIQFVCGLLISRDHKNKWYFLFSPSFLVFFYVNINFFIGAYSLKENISLEVYQHRSTSYNLISSLHIAYAYMTVCSLISMLVLPKQLIDVNKEIKKENNVEEYSYFKITIFIILFLTFSLIKVDLSLIGGAGDFSTIPKSIASILLFYELSKVKYKFRYFLYAIVLLIFVFTNFESKREAVFMLIPILFLENLFGNIQTFKFSIKKFFISVFSIIVLVYALLVMTIARGFGGYDVTNPLNSVKYVKDLINDFNIGGLLFTISEAPTTTYVSIKAVSLASENSNLLTYGSTYWKLFFIPIPRSLFEEKPMSMTLIYTKIEDPSFYGVGGSLPINVFAEAFWNFHFFGVVFIGFMIYFLNQSYSKMISLIQLNTISPLVAGYLFAFTYLIGFYRGFGFDLYCVNIIVGFFFSFAFYKVCVFFIK